MRFAPTGPPSCPVGPPVGTQSGHPHGAYREFTGPWGALRYPSCSSGGFGLRASFLVYDPFVLARYRSQFVGRPGYPSACFAYLVYFVNRFKEVRGNSHKGTGQIRSILTRYFETQSALPRSFLLCTSLSPPEVDPHFVGGLEGSTHTAPALRFYSVSGYPARNIPHRYPLSAFRTLVSQRPKVYSLRSLILPAGGVLCLLSPFYATRKGILRPKSALRASRSRHR